MIRKIKSIANLGVFKGFDWDKEVLGGDGNAREFKEINIIYGRNYSGKTTLSRILRAMETGQLSDKFENPSFCVAFTDGMQTTENNLTSHGKKIRVFNEDFIRDNLRFITNPDDSIEPFAILGKDNNKIEQEIESLEKEFFGHQFLSLEARKYEVVGEESKRIRFEIIRDGKKAYHLSEGECSLLAFCYFLAKLNDIDTRDSKPIIWIDDPISSLDGNHIFFVYSLLNAEIVSGGRFEQLFVSTHNLDFLKYLKRLPGTHQDKHKKEEKKRYQHLIVERKHSHSTLCVMPNYLKEYITEFNYLFHQIHKCASIETIDDTNYVTFYNFGNNARKFFEIYLYYKFPDQGMTEDTLRLFFGDENTPSVLADRINNEYSHLCGVFERGSTPVEVPEMQTAARKIIEVLKKDNEQYSALLKSIDEPGAVP